MLYVLVAVGATFVALMWARGKQTQVQDDLLCRKLDHAAQIFEFQIKTSSGLDPIKKRVRTEFWEWFRDDEVSCRDPFEVESVIFEREDE